MGFPNLVKVLLAVVVIATTIVLNSGQTSLLNTVNNALSLHNKYRTRHRTAPLNVSTDLCRVAQYCARFYSSGKSPHTCSKAIGYGENLAIIMTGRGAPSFDSASQTGIQNWYNEIQNYNFRNPPPSAGIFGDFTQIVWKATTLFGFGCASKDKGTYCVGIYKPPGNVIGQLAANVAHPR